MSILRTLKYGDVIDLSFRLKAPLTQSTPWGPLSIITAWPVRILDPMCSSTTNFLGRPLHFCDKPIYHGLGLMIQ